MKKIFSVLTVLLISFSVFAVDISVDVGKYENDENYLYFTGFANSKNKSLGLAKAEADARANAVKELETAVDVIIVDYKNEAGEDENTQYINAFETLSKQSAKGYLRNFKRVEWYKEGDNGYWVIMRIPREDWINALKKSNNDTIGNNKTFKKSKSAKEANEMMNKSIDKYFGPASFRNNNSETDSPDETESKSGVIENIKSKFSK